jgi:hypothetical protein
MKPLRCRLGLHAWRRVRQPRGADEEWITTCRDCRQTLGSGASVSTWIFAAFVVASAVVWWFAPLLGAVMMIGAVTGLAWMAGPAAVGRVARWLSR